MPAELEATHIAGDGTERKSHYGPGRQPWDDFLENGWAAHFAAACVVKYLRRTKEDPNDIVDARWYYTRLKELAAKEADTYARGTAALARAGDYARHCRTTLAALDRMLLPEEHARLSGLRE